MYTMPHACINVLLCYDCYFVKPAHGFLLTPISFFPLTLPFECDNNMRKRQLFYVFLNQEHGYMVNMFSTNWSFMGNVTTGKCFCQHSKSSDWEMAKKSPNF